MTKNSYRALSAMSVCHKMLNVASLSTKVNPGGVAYVKVTYVQNGPQKFVNQRQNSDAVGKLGKLSKKLSYFAVRNSKALVNPERGTPCFAKSSRDKLLHRAEEKSCFARCYTKESRCTQGCRC